jgi:hypothetical protein
MGSPRLLRLGLAGVCRHDGADRRYSHSRESWRRDRAIAYFAPEERAQALGHSVKLWPV